MSQLKKNLGPALFAVAALALGTSAARADWNLASSNAGTVSNNGGMGEVRNDTTINSSVSIQAAGAATSFTGTVVAPGAVNPAVVNISGTASNFGRVSNIGNISTATNVSSYGGSVSIGAVGAAASATYSMGAYAH